MPADDASRREALADFLRARRARLKPADVGFRDDGASGRRRTPGLRREEVAELSGVGVTWYTWLEQGRDIVPSAQVIDALARALLLDEDQHRYLRELSGLTPAARATPPRRCFPDCGGWSTPPHRTWPRSTTRTSTTWYGTGRTSWSGTIPASTPPTGATCCG